MQAKHKGMLLVISGPSGAGKGTLYTRLLADDDSMTFSVSYATRKPRPGEVDGRDYHFVSDEAFDRMIARDGFLEYATVHEHRYGTPMQPVLDALARGRNMVLDIDPQGAMRVMDRMPDCVTVFILPPSYKELRRRLVTRNTEHPEEIERRLRNARGEIANMGRYTYLVVNDDRDAAYAQLQCVVAAEKLRSTRYFPIVAEE